MRSWFRILPTNYFYGPNYETGKPAQWGIADASDKPLGIAGTREHLPN